MPVHDQTSLGEARRAAEEVGRVLPAMTFALSEELLGRARRAAQAAGLLLEQRPAGLTLCGDGMELAGDFGALLPRLRQDRLARELLVRAARVKGAPQPLRAVDATAGLGEDALLLAAAGFEVTLVERDPVIAALLADALERAAADERLAPIAARMQLVCAESTAYLRSLEESPALVYLDPMFPAKGKAALTKKKLQLFQRLEAPCSEEEALMDAACACRPLRIVVKRPLKAPALAGRKPSHSVEGKTIRYDVIVPTR